MKFQKLSSLLTNFLLLIIIILSVTACSKEEYPKPSKDFYANDYADILHPITKRTIIIEGELLYNDTKKIKQIGGTQIVFATFLVENVGDIARYNRTDIYRQWEIGKNDMGILVLFFFTEDEEEGNNYLYLEETQIEVGYRMEQYFTAGEQGKLLDDTIYSDEYDDLDMLVALLLYEILTIVYVEVYDYDSFSYDMEYFQEAIKDYTGDDIENQNWLYMILYFFTGSNNYWFAIAFVMLILLGGGLRLRRNRGGGGSSGGYGIFRR